MPLHFHKGAGCLERVVPGSRTVHKNKLNKDTELTQIGCRSRFLHLHCLPGGNNYNTVDMFILVYSKVLVTAYCVLVYGKYNYCDFEACAYDTLVKEMSVDELIGD